MQLTYRSQGSLERLNMFTHVSDANKVRRGQLNPDNAIEHIVPSIFIIVQGVCLAFIKFYRYSQNVRKVFYNDSALGFKAL